tara:strand:- start:375 stop:830 length:456 start_codon:yes stop_codon:yes gene_type:complete
MIITCDQCDKRFEIESNLIPQKGRLLQCSSCSHKWFYKKDEQEETAIVLEDQDVTKPKNKPIFNENRNVKVFNNLESSHKIKRKHSYANLESKKISFLNVILLFIISSIGLIILLDTFKSPIGLMIPNIEFILENLYETLKDILLFIQDLF